LEPRLLDRDATEQGHDEEQATVLGDVVVDHGDDRGMADCVRQVRLATELTLDIGVRRGPLVEDLDGDRMPVPMAPLVNGAHAADPDQALQQVASAEGRPDT
jgi:hypothetical protein